MDKKELLDKYMEMILQKGINTALIESQKIGAKIQNANTEDIEELKQRVKKLESCMLVATNILEKLEKL